MIGDRFDVVVELEGDRMQMIAFPEFELEKDSPLELVANHTPDTISIDTRRRLLRKRYTLTSFEEGRYNLGVMAVLAIDKNQVDTLYTRDSLKFDINTFIIDSTSQSIFDIKSQREMPFKYREIRGYVRWSIVGIILLALLVFGLIRLAAHYNHPLGAIFKPKPKVPAHIVAIEALEQLHNKKLWQSNHHKSYYSNLTDILRTYISERYNVSAMEMTSDEIIAAMRTIELPKKCEMDLQSLLRLADLVKFAKAEPEGEENERHYLSSYYFVEETKLIEESETSENV